MTAPQGEVPVADLAEQQLSAGPEDTDTPIDETPVLEADPADVAEQRQTVVEDEEPPR